HHREHGWRHGLTGQRQRNGERINRTGVHARQPILFLWCSGNTRKGASPGSKEACRGWTSAWSAVRSVRGAPCRAASLVVVVIGCNEFWQVALPVTWRRSERLADL